MQAAAVELNSGTYKEPLKMTVSEWLDIWLRGVFGRREADDGAELHAARQ